MAIFSRDTFVIPQSKSSGQLFIIYIQLVHNLRLKLSKMIKHCMVSYLSSDKYRAGMGQKGRKSFVEIRARILRSSKLVLSLMEVEVELLGTDAHF